MTKQVAIEWRRRSAKLLPWILAAPLIFGPACANMPTKPRANVIVSGKVTTTSGYPIVRAEVAFYSDDGLPSFYGNYAHTDSSGAYSLPLVEGAWRVSIYLPFNVAADYDYFHDRPVQITAGNSTLNWQIHGFRVRGRVISPTGEVLNEGYASASEATGAYASSNVVGGEYNLVLLPSTYDFYGTGGYESGMPRRTLSGVPIHADTTFDIALQGDPVTGVVRGPGGAPMESLQIGASSNNNGAGTRTGTDGSYTLYLPPDTYRFLCSPNPADGYILARFFAPRVIAGPTPMDFDVSGVTWSGTVRSSVTMLPVPGVEVRASLFADSFNRTAFSNTDGAGRFALVLEPNREYTLLFSGNGLAARMDPGIVALADTTFDILLDPAPTP